MMRCLAVLILAIGAPAWAQSDAANSPAAEAEEPKAEPVEEPKAEPVEEPKAEPVEEPKAEEPPPLKKVAILEFRAEGLDEATTKNLNELFTSEAGTVPGYQVIGQSEIKDMVSFEIQKQTLGCVDEDCYSEMGNALGVDFIVSGSVGKVGETFVVNVKLIDIKNARTKSRVGETIMGRVELLTDTVRVIAWKLMMDTVPDHLTAAFAATKARLEADAARAEAEAARARGDAAAMAAAQTALAQAEQARAEAEKAKAEAEKARIEAESRRTARGPRRVRKEAPPPPPPPPPAGWPRIARNISSIVGGLGLVGGGVMHGVSYYWAKEKVGDGQATSEGGMVYAGTQRDAKLAHDLRTWAIISYIVGGVGVIAATVFGIIEPDSPSTAAVVPTANGFAVVF